MSDSISFADGLAIIQHARAALNAPGDAPAPAPTRDMPKYGPHNPTLSKEQADTLQLVWQIMGINGKTVGPGQQVTHTTQPTPAPAPVPVSQGIAPTEQPTEQPTQGE